MSYMESEPKNDERATAVAINQPEDWFEHDCPSPDIYTPPVFDWVRHREKTMSRVLSFLILQQAVVMLIAVLALVTPGVPASAYYIMTSLVAAAGTAAGIAIRGYFKRN